MYGPQVSLRWCPGIKSKKIQDFKKETNALLEGRAFDSTYFLWSLGISPRNHKLKGSENLEIKVPMNRAD